MKRFLLIPLFTGLSLIVHAQYAGDALRFSQTQPGSDARFGAIGNAHTAIGGDLSSFGGNPAGLGLFTKSEANISFEFNNYTSTANYLNKYSNGSQDRLNMHQGGVVFYIPALRPKGADLDRGWISFTTGLSYNRHADFGNSLLYSGTNPNNSIADYFAELSTNNYGTPSSLAQGSLERMAYDSYLIGYDTPGDYYFPETDVNNIQTKNEDRRGGQTQVNMAFAANYSNKFYLGLNLGFAGINYTSNSNFTEKGFNVTENSNYQATFLQDQVTAGKGFNAKMGFIYKPNSVFRIGASFETPTWYTIDDSYTEVLNSKYTNAGLNYTNGAENYSFVYHLRTPLKLSGGLGIFFGKAGFISADFDMVDYAKIKFRGVNNLDLQTISDNNQEVFDNYKKTYNYRLGAEFKLDQMAFRAGYGIQGNPYKNLADAGNTTKTYSGGIGYRVKNYYADLCYQQVAFSTSLKPYTLADGSAPKALIDSKKTNIFLTFGIRF
ncbi:MAG: hypothetical protein ACKOWL_01265 [Sphingobacteriaceae bacterium]